MTTSTFGQADFVIITALPKEAQAVVNRLDNHQTVREQQQDIRTYHCGTVPITGTDRAYHVAVVLLPGTGELAAANATTDAIVRWNPNYVLMVGIAAGIPDPKEDRELGDVVVAEQVIGYEHAKVTDKGYEYREQEYPASKLLLDRVRNFWDTSWRTKSLSLVPTTQSVQYRNSTPGRSPLATKSSPRPSSATGSRRVGPSSSPSKWKRRAFFRQSLIALRFATR